MFLFSLFIVSVIVALVIYYQRYRSGNPEVPEESISSDMESHTRTEAGESAFTTVYTCNDWVEANLLAGKLESSGIETFLADDAMFSVNPLWGGALGGIKIKVKTSEYDQALLVLEGDLEPRVPCPQCGSMHTTKYLKSGEGPNGTITGFLETSLQVGGRPDFEPAYRCNDCGHEFEAVSPEEE